MGKQKREAGNSLSLSDMTTPGLLLLSLCESTAACLDTHSSTTVIAQLYFLFPAFCPDEMILYVRVSSHSSCPLLFTMIQSLAFPLNIGPQWPIVISSQPFHFIPLNLLVNLFTGFPHLLWVRDGIWHSNLLLLLNVFRMENGTAVDYGNAYLIKIIIFLIHCWRALWMSRVGYLSVLVCVRRLFSWRYLLTYWIVNQLIFIFRIQRDHHWFTWWSKARVNEVWFLSVSNQKREQFNPS